SEEEDDDEDDFKEEADINDDERTESDNDEVTKELYKDVNVNLGNKDANMTYVDQSATEQQHASHQSGFEQEEEDSHVTLTLVLDAQKTGDVATLVIEKHVTESLEDDVLTRSSSKLQSSYEVAATLFEFELTKILIEKMKKNKPFDIADYKRELYDALVKSYNTDKDIFESYGEVFSLKRSRDERYKERDPSTGSDRGTKRRKSSKNAESSKDSKSKSAYAEELSHTVKDSGMQQDQEFITRDNDEQPTNKEVTKANWFKKPERPLTPDPDWSFEFFLRNRVLLWRCLKIRVLWWTVLIDSSLIGLTVLIEIVALKTILVVILLCRLMKSRWTCLIRNILTILNEIPDCCGLKLLDVIMKYGKIIFSSSEWTLVIAMV
nr:hypothetical protein [Tanacetum cinerariifolium]